MSDVEDQPERDLAREAVRIFLRLAEQPNDPDALSAREKFLARGEAERQIYGRMSQRWQTSKHHGKRRRARGLIVVLAMLAAGYFAYGPARIALLADKATGRTAESVTLASGDTAILDADSAIADKTAEGERLVTLLEGAAIFQVSRSAETFKVRAGNLEVVVLGTEFEVAYSGNSMLISVVEGVVEVRRDDDTWTLEPGQRLVLRGPEPPEVQVIDKKLIGSWRQNRFIAKDMPLADLAAIIDRRLAGRVLITDSALAKVRVSGGVDLTNPLRSLRALSAAAGAQMVAAPPLITVIKPDQ